MHLKEYNKELCFSGSFRPTQMKNTNLFYNSVLR